MKYAEQLPGRLRLRLRVLARDLHGHRAGLRRSRSATRSWTSGSPAPGREIILNLPVHRRAVHPERLRRPDRVDDAGTCRAASTSCLSRAPPQRPRHRRRRRRAGRAGRRGPDRGLPVRQRRADRQRLPGHPGPEPVQPGHRPDDRLLRHRRDPAHRRVLQPAAGAPAPPVRGRPGLHGVLRLAPGRDQEGLRGAGAGRRGRRDAGPRLPLGGAVPADRPAGRRPHATRP